MIPLTTQRRAVQRLINQDPSTVVRHRRGADDATYTGLLAPTGVGGNYYSRTRQASYPPATYGWVLILTYDNEQLLKEDELDITHAGVTQRFHVVTPRYMGDKWEIEIESLD